MAEYNLYAYSQMLLCEERMAAYEAAIRAAIKPGAVVLEIGAGTGVMALLACKYGAGRVHAIEPAAEIVLARQAARDNGFEDRIVIHHARSTDVTLAERCDVLISDLRGVSPLYTSHLLDLIDARTRLLKADANWICQKDTFHVAVAEAPLGRSQVESWWDGSRWGLDLGSALPYATQSHYLRRCLPSELLSASEPWACIDYPYVESPHVRGQTALRVARAAPADGLSVWFEASLFGGVGFSNAPGKPPNVYGSMFLPWPKAVSLQVGDRVELRIDAVLSGAAYEWTWETRVRREGQAQPLAEFRQSTLKGLIFSPEALVRCSARFVPPLSRVAEEEKFLLGLIDGHTTQGELAAGLRAHFPDRFPDESSALNRVFRTVSHLR